jgi:hypothetical protein
VPTISSTYRRAALLTTQEDRVQVNAAGMGAGVIGQCDEMLVCCRYAISPNGAWLRCVR